MREPQGEQRAVRGRMKFAQVWSKKEEVIDLTGWEWHGAADRWGCCKASGRDDSRAQFWKMIGYTSDRVRKQSNKTEGTAETKGLLHFKWQEV